MSDSSIGFRSKVLNSAKMSTLRFASDIVLRLTSTVVLTRLLAPEIYGIFAVVVLYLYLLEMILDIGIRNLVLTKEGEIDDDFLSTCWTVSILRGLLFGLLSAGIGGVIFLLQVQGIFAADSPYAAPVLPWAIAAVGSTGFVFGFQTPLRFLPERDMQFGRNTFMHISANVFGLIVTIALALYLRSVWALVLGYLARAIFEVVLCYYLFPGPPMRLQLRRDYLGLVIGRGKWIAGNSVLTALAQSADRLVLGFVMSSSTFGYYFIARQLVDMVVRFLVAINDQSGVQVFRHLQKSDLAEFRRNYYRYRLFFDAVAGLSTGALFVLAPLAVDIIFDDRYAPVAPIVQTLIWGALLTGPLLLRAALGAERRFKELAQLALLSTITLWAGLGIAIFGFSSESMAITVIALYHLPEAMVLILRGGDRDWVIIWREFLGFAFCLLGILCGWSALWVWNLVT
jgi:O-antigen/teichoic acid export membrane protein